MKSLFEQMGGTYREENGYLIPNLTLPEEEQIEIGVWGSKTFGIYQALSQRLLHFIAYRF